MVCVLSRDAVCSFGGSERVVVRGSKVTVRSKDNASRWLMDLEISAPLDEDSEDTSILWLVEGACLPVLPCS